MKKSVTQQHNLGCGLACVAFILDINYQSLANRIIDTKVEKCGFYCKELVTILKKYNQNYIYRYIKIKFKKIIYKNNVIVYIKKSTRYPKGHYLTRYNNLWMDPWINFSENKDIKEAKSGFRKRLPGKPIYIVISE